MYGFDWKSPRRLREEDMGSWAHLIYSCVKFPPTLVAIFSILNPDEETMLANLAKGTIVPIHQG